MFSVIMLALSIFKRFVAHNKILIVNWLLGHKNNGVSAIVAPNGGNCLLMFFFLQNGHALIMCGIPIGKINCKSTTIKSTSKLL